MAFVVSSEEKNETTWHKQKERSFTTCKECIKIEIIVWEMEGTYIF